MYQVYIHVNMLEAKGIERKSIFSRFLIYNSTYKSHVSTYTCCVLPMCRPEEAAHESKPTCFNNAACVSLIFI